MSTRKPTTKRRILEALRIDLPLQRQTMQAAGAATARLQAELAYDAITRNTAPRILFISKAYPGGGPATFEHTGISTSRPRLWSEISADFKRIEQQRLRRRQILHRLIWLGLAFVSGAALALTVTQVGA